MIEATGNLEQDKKYKKNKLQLMECYLYKLRMTSCILEGITLATIVEFWLKCESLKDQPIEVALENLPFLAGCCVLGTIAKAGAGISEETRKELVEDYNEEKRVRNRKK